MVHFKGRIVQSSCVIWYFKDSDWFVFLRWPFQLNYFPPCLLQIKQTNKFNIKGWYSTSIDGCCRFHCGGKLYIVVSRDCFIWERVFSLTTQKHRSCIPWMWLVHWKCPRLVVLRFRSLTSTNLTVSRDSSPKELSLSSSSPPPCECLSSSSFLNSASSFGERHPQSPLPLRRVLLERWRLSLKFWWSLQWCVLCFLCSFLSTHIQ